MLDVLGLFIGDKAVVTKTKISTVVVDDISIEIHRKAIKNIHLRIIPPTGKVRLSAPISVSNNMIFQFISEKISWIKTHQARIKQRPTNALKELLEGEVHYVWGQKYTLHILPTTTKHHVVAAQNNRLELRVGKETNQHNKLNVLNGFYRAQMHDKLAQLLPDWEQALGVSVNAVGIKNMRTKWGSCNIQAKRIWLNLELAKKPVDCLEYVLVHELVHLFERYHNARFYSLMDKYLPAWRERSEILNRA